MDDNNMSNFNQQPPEPYGNGGPPGGPRKAPGMAIASLVCGIVGLFIFGVILGVPAIIFGIMARNKVPENTGMATAGLVLGILDIALWAVVLCFCGSMFAAFA